MQEGGGRFWGKFLVNNNKYPCAPLCKKEKCREFRRETYKISTKRRKLSLRRRGGRGVLLRGGAASAGGVVCVGLSNILDSDLGGRHPAERPHG